MWSKKNKVRSGEFSDEYMFVNRYRHAVSLTVPGPAAAEAKKSYEKKIARNFELITKAQNRAESMKYFDYIMARPDFRVKELQKAKEQGAKVIGTFCIQVPEELILAAGAIPLRLSCGLYESISVAENIVPSNICPLVKSSIGFPLLKITPFFQLCDVIIIPTTCDAKKKMADILSNFMNVWTIEPPQNRDRLDARDFWLGQVELLRKKLERLTGNNITRKRLEQSTRLLQARTATVRRFLELKRRQEILINGKDSLLAIQASFFDDTERWIRYLDALNIELENHAKNGKTVAPPDTPRIMLTGSPIIWPGWKVLNAIEETEAVVVIDDSCAGSQFYYNTVEVPDWSMRSMMTAIADKYLLPTVCPIFVHSDDRVDRILELAQQYKAEGIVYHLLRLCQLMDFEYNKVNSVLRERSIPLLKIETEYSEEDTGQIKTRVEAFIEMLKARRGR